MDDCIAVAVRVHRIISASIHDAFNAYDWAFFGLSTLAYFNGNRIRRFVIGFSYLKYIPLSLIDLFLEYIPEEYYENLFIYNPLFPLGVNCLFRIVKGITVKILEIHVTSIRYMLIMAVLVFLFVQNLNNGKTAYSVVSFVLYYLTSISSHSFNNNNDNTHPDVWTFKKEMQMLIILILLPYDPFYGNSLDHPYKKIPTFVIPTVSRQANATNKSVPQKKMTIADGPFYDKNNDPKATCEAPFRAKSEIPPLCTSDYWREACNDVPKYFDAVIFFEPTNDDIIRNLKEALEEMISFHRKSPPFDDKWKDLVHESHSKHRQVVKETLLREAQSSQQETWQILQSFGIERAKFSVDSLPASSASGDSIGAVWTSSWITNTIFLLNVPFSDKIIHEIDTIPKRGRIFVEPSFDHHLKSFSVHSFKETSPPYKPEAPMDTSKVLPSMSSTRNMSTSASSHDKPNFQRTLEANQVALLGVKEAWKMATGKRIVAGFLDTGASLEHPAVLNGYRGYNETSQSLSSSHSSSWLDATGENPHTPNDIEGHGTKVVSMFNGHCGPLYLGTAPSAKWIMVDQMTMFNLREFSTVKDTFKCAVHSAEWLVNPNEDPSLGVRIVSSSTCYNQLDRVYQSLRFELEIWKMIYDVWNVCNMVMVVAAGNSGDKETYVSSIELSLPYPISIGSIGLPHMSPSAFSSYGTTLESVYGKVSPDFMGPGEGVTVPRPHLSMLWLSEEEERYLIKCQGKGENQTISSKSDLLALEKSVQLASGTSFAAPFVAGVIALLLDVDPTLSRDEIYAILKETSIKPCSPSYTRCPINRRYVLEKSLKYLYDSIDAGQAGKNKSTTQLSYPNMFYGHGIVNATAAVLMAKNRMSSYGTSSKDENWNDNARGHKRVVSRKDSSIWPIRQLAHFFELHDSSAAGANQALQTGGIALLAVILHYA